MQCNISNYKGPTANCAVCLDDIDQGAKIVTHAKAGTNHNPLHLVCFQKWVAVRQQTPNAKITCPGCVSELNTNSLLTLKERIVKNLGSCIKNTRFIGKDLLVGSGKALALAMGCTLVVMPFLQPNSNEIKTYESFMKISMPAVVVTTIAGEIIRSAMRRQFYNLVPEGPLPEAEATERAKALIGYTFYNTLKATSIVSTVAAVGSSLFLRNYDLLTLISKTAPTAAAAGGLYAVYLSLEAGYNDLAKNEKMQHELINDGQQPALNIED